jgi:hypothetical protein
MDHATDCRDISHLYLVALRGAPFIEASLTNHRRHHRPPQIERQTRLFLRFRQHVPQPLLDRYGRGGAVYGPVGARYGPLLRPLLDLYEILAHAIFRSLYVQVHLAAS